MILRWQFIRICHATAGQGPAVPKYGTLNIEHKVTLLAMDTAGACDIPV